MRRRKNYKRFGRSFKPESVSTTDRGRAGQRTEKRHGESDREESLSNHRWHRRRRTTETNDLKESTPTPATIGDAREIIKQTTEKKKESSFPNIVFSDNNTCQSEHSQEPKMAAKPNNDQNCANQTDFNQPTSTTQNEPTNKNNTHRNRTVTWRAWNVRVLCEPCGPNNNLTRRNPPKCRTTHNDINSHVGTPKRTPIGGKPWDENAGTSRYSQPRN